MEPTKRYYISASSSTCYDKSGITYPYVLAIDLAKLVKSIASKPATRWAKQFGWYNQPQVLCFTATYHEAKDIWTKLPRGLALCEK